MPGASYTDCLCDPEPACVPITVSCFCTWVLHPFAAQHSHFSVESCSPYLQDPLPFQSGFPLGTASQVVTAASLFSYEFRTLRLSDPDFSRYPPSGPKSSQPPRPYYQVPDFPAGLPAKTHACACVRTHTELPDLQALISVKCQVSGITSLLGYK